ncbi:hypothetical protein FOL47_009043 [Perkinsus chesapeaki]|uniref:Uncharacterized protein n=1 Tax=Perkinsus chesapeaki TaxID=330153 RepID=A0A7J6LAN2_PERCH|nr:hypothetical protein FOL47_009043 [Perkinsus chesapeaki]
MSLDPSRIEELLNQPTTRELCRSDDIIRIQYVVNMMQNRRLADVASMVWKYVPPIREEPNTITLNDCVKISTENRIVYAEEIRPGRIIALDRSDEAVFPRPGRTLLFNTNDLSAAPQVIANHERAPDLFCVAGDMVYFQEDADDRSIYRVPIDGPGDYEPEEIELDEFLVPDRIIDIGGVLVAWQPTRSCVYGLRLDTMEWWEVADVACSIENLDARFAGEHWPEGKYAFPKLELLFTPADGLLNKVALWRGSDDRDHPHGIMMEKKLKHLSPEVVKFCPRSNNKAIVALISQQGKGHGGHRFGAGIGILDFETGCFISRFDYNYRTSHISAMSVSIKGGEVKAIMLFPSRYGKGITFAMSATITAVDGFYCKNCGKKYKKQGFLNRHEMKCAAADDAATVGMKERKFHFRYGYDSDASSRSPESDDSDVRRNECVVM